MKFMVQVTKNDDEGTYSVHAPTLKGCWSQGNTREEALANIKMAIEEYLESFDEEPGSETHYVMVEQVA